MNKTLLSIVTPCYNEQDNIDELYRRVKEAITPLQSRFDFELIIIDNHSSDSTPQKLRSLASADPGVKVIFNTRNFGHIRSPYYGILQSRGAATIYLASDLQDPPELITEFVRFWEEGSQSNGRIQATNKQITKLLSMVLNQGITKQTP